MSSRKPAAKRFRKWITSKVIPSILRTGAYGQPAPLDLGDARALRQALLSYTADVIALQEEVAVLAPKAAAMARLEAADGSMSVTDAAKTLGVAPRALFSKLSKLGWIYRRQDDGPWVAYQAALDLGRLQHRAYTITRSDGREHVRHQVVLTAKGLTRLAELLGVDRADAPGGEQLEAA